MEMSGGIRKCLISIIKKREELFPQSSSSYWCWQCRTDTAVFSVRIGAAYEEMDLDTCLCTGHRSRGTFRGTSLQAQAKPDDTILEGVYAGDISLSGMTREEAKAAIQSYVDSLAASTITLNVVEGNTVNVTASELGLGWANPELVEEAVNLGKSGNVVVRYKALKVWSIRIRFMISLFPLTGKQLHRLWKINATPLTWRR